MSSFQIQVTNFMSAMAYSIAFTVSNEQCAQEVEDFSPPSSEPSNTEDLHTCRIQSVPIAPDLAPEEYLRAWLPSANTLVAALDLTPNTPKNNSHTHLKENNSHTHQRENNSHTHQRENTSHTHLIENNSHTHLRENNSIRDFGQFVRTTRITLSFCFRDL